MKTLFKNITVVNPFCKPNEDQFKDYIAISSDSLLIIDKELKLVENIIRGDDNSGLYLSAETVDDFLDAILFFKQIISSGKNPMEFV